MKNQSFPRRLGFAMAGLASALRSEPSFRFHLIAAFAAFLVLAWLQPAPLWWAIVALTIVSVLGVELVNTAIENLADHLHPEQHPSIAVVKDCAAAAVLIVSAGAIAVAVALIWEIVG